MTNPSPARPELTVNQGRFCIIAAAVLWSTSGFFGKVLTRPTWLELGLETPKIEPEQMAFFRLLFAGLFLVPLVRRTHLTVKPAMVGMALTFAAMNAMFLRALTQGPAANAILLQYTAPLWMYLACVWVLREPADRRNTVALVCGLAGVAIILAGNWRDGQENVLLLGLGSGVTFGLILLFLRVLRAENSAWLTVWNHLTAALLLAPFALLTYRSGLELRLPSGPQLAVLVVFGAFQMGFPYFLMARGLRVVSPQEAGAITLIEPLLNPLWAYLVWSKTETPGLATLIGGAFILGALAWRYLMPGANVGQASRRSE